MPPGWPPETGLRFRWVQTICQTGARPPNGHYFAAIRAALCAPQWCHRHHHDDGSGVFQRTVRLGWAAAVLVGVSCMFSVSVFYQAGHAYNPLEAALYASLHRLGWCVATSWVIFACVTGNGGVMQRALTWRPLVPLSRLTYCAYLVNGAVVLWGVASVRQPRTLSTPTLAMEVVAQIFATFLGALILSLMLESPIHGLERALLGRYRNGDKSDKNADEENKQHTSNDQHNSEDQASSQL
ncbi:hypothetical protein FOCC_FOCC013602 [Frankliniella occidentalis]|nr:hypothetical protein FOCC_FOCC013602 [Frankliniella occidentalis]